MALGKKTGGLILACAMADGGRRRSFPCGTGTCAAAAKGRSKSAKAGVRFAGPKGHAWQWKLDQIRQLELAPDRIVVVELRKRQAAGDGTPLRIQRRGSGGRTVCAAQGPHGPAAGGRAGAAAAGSAIWSLPVKHVGRAGSLGTLELTAETIAYRTQAKDESRTWRYTDIAGISSSGPFQLTITTLELRAGAIRRAQGFQFRIAATHFGRQIQRAVASGRNEERENSIPGDTTRQIGQRAIRACRFFDRQGRAGEFYEE
jgi:hypothetical protein